MAPQTNFSQELAEHREAALHELKNESRGPGSSTVAKVVGTIFFPITLLGSFYVVNPNEEVVVLSYGHYAKTARTPGFHWAICFGRQLHKISTKKRSVELPKTTVIDSNGNPLIISAVIVYQFLNSKRAVLDVDNNEQFVKSQAETALKQTLSKFPYESSDGSPCLKTEASEIGEHLCSVLQDKVIQAGAVVESFQLKEISYAPEIAVGMLKRQQATAIIEARQTIVEGSVSIATHAVARLEENGISLSPEERARLVTNLLTVICAERDAQPTIAL